MQAPEAGRTAAMYLSRNGTKSATGDVGRTAADDSEGSAKSASKDAGNESQAVGSGRLEDVAEDMQVHDLWPSLVTVSRKWR